jgi:prevent-host-death family protein
VDTVTVRELRNDGGAVVDKVARGERLIVTRDGKPVAELRPLQRVSPPTADLIRRRRRLPRVDPQALRRDIDSAIDVTV